jgi:uncharacterized membrane protein YkvA (DUF1232 family)
MDTPKNRRWWWIVALVWSLELLALVSPIDLVPDLIPVLGLADDLLGFALAVVTTVVASRRQSRQSRQTAQVRPTEFLLTESSS